MGQGNPVVVFRNVKDHTAFWTFHGDALVTHVFVSFLKRVGCTRQRLPAEDREETGFVCL
jgi:hypothetical protein